MCRLFGMSGGERRVRATFWLLEASEPMDEDPGWRLLDPGELVHVGPTLVVESSIVLDVPPARPLTLADLHPRAAAAQAPPPAH